MPRDKKVLVGVQSLRPSSVRLVPGRRQMQPGGEALQGYGCSSHTPCLLGVTSPGLPKEGKAHAFSLFQKTEKNLKFPKLPWLMG